MKNKQNRITNLSEKSTMWIGSPTSLVVHTMIFVCFFVLGFVGVSWDRVLLALTTIVSLEAIYLAIFIQMTVNRNTQSLEEVEENIDEIQEDIDEIQGDVDEIQENVGEIQEDVEVIHEEVDELIEEDHIKEVRTEAVTLEKIQQTLEKLTQDIENIKRNYRP